MSLPVNIFYTFFDLYTPTGCMALHEEVCKAHNE